MGKEFHTLTARRGQAIKVVLAHGTRARRRINAWSTTTLTTHLVTTVVERTVRMAQTRDAVAATGAIKAVFAKLAVFSSCVVLASTANASEGIA